LGSQRWCAERKLKILLGPALVLVAAGAAEGRVEAVQVERLAEAFRLPHVGMKAAMVERIDSAPLRLRVAVDEQLHARFPGDPVAKRVHVAKLPGRVDMEEREGRRRGEEGLAGEVEHHRAVLAHGIEHHRPLGLRDDFAQDVDALRLELLEMGEAAV
jgi:hypothetical protein